MKKIILSPSKGGRVLKNKRSTTPAKMEEQSIEKTPRTRAIRNDLSKSESQAKIKRPATSPLIQHIMDKRRRASTDTNSSTDDKKSQPSTVSSQRVKLKPGAESSGEQGSDVEKKNFAINTINDSKDTLASEMKRLSTTQGFWSSKPTSRSNSPVAASEQGEGLLLSKSLSSSRKNSKSSTPDISPSPSRRKASNKINKQQEEKEELSKLNVSAMELKRLKTTDGFAYPKFSPSGLRPSSRDVSPSSTSSLERTGRQMARSLASNDDKSLLGNLENSTPLTKGKRGRPKGKVNSSKKLVTNGGKDITAHSSASNVDDNNELDKLTLYSLMDSDKSVLGRPKNKSNKNKTLSKPNKSKIFSEEVLNVSENKGTSLVLSDIVTTSPNIDLSAEEEKSSVKVKAGRGRPKLTKFLQGKSPVPVTVVASSSDILADEALVNSPSSHAADISVTRIGDSPSTEKVRRGRPRKLNNQSSAKVSGAVRKIGRPKMVKENIIDYEGTLNTTQEALGPKSLPLAKAEEVKTLKKKSSFKKQRIELALKDGNQGGSKMNRSGKKAVVANETKGVMLYKIAKGKGKKAKVKDNTNETVFDKLQIVTGQKIKKKKSEAETGSVIPVSSTMDPNPVEMQTVDPIMGESTMKSKPKRIKLPKTFKREIVSRLRRKSLSLKGKMSNTLSGIEAQVKQKRRVSEKHSFAVRPSDQLTELSNLTELKRLNTTVGFWSSPIVSTDVSVRRSKHVKMSEDTAQHDKNPPPQLCFSKPITPKKHESSLLQHRKKKLNSLKHNLKKGKPAAPESPDVTMKRRRKILALEGILSISSQVEARRKRKSLIEDKSLHKLQSSIGSSVGTKIEETENLNKNDAEELEKSNIYKNDAEELEKSNIYKNDAEELEKSNIYSTDSEGGKLNDEVKRVTEDLPGENNDVEQSSASVSSKEVSVSDMSSEHNTALCSLSAGKDENSCNVLIPHSMTCTSIVPQTEGSGICEPDIASLTLSEEVRTVTKVNSPHQLSQNEPADLVVTGIVQTSPEVVHEESVSILANKEVPSDIDLPEKSFASVGMKNAGGCITISNVSSDTEEVLRAPMKNAEIAFESGNVLVDVDSLNQAKNSNFDDSKEILGGNTEDVPVCNEMEANNSISGCEYEEMPLKALDVEVNDKTSITEPLTGAVDEKTFNENLNHVPVPGDNGSPSVSLDFNNIISNGKETFDENLNDVPVPGDNGSPSVSLDFNNIISNGKETADTTALDSDVTAFSSQANAWDQVEGIVLNKHKRRKKTETKFYRYKKHKPIEMWKKRLNALYGEAQECFSTGSDNVTGNLPPGSCSVQENEDIYPKDPLRRVKKRKRNVWKRGVLKKPAYIARKKQSQQQVASTQTADQRIQPPPEEGETTVKESSSDPPALDTPNTGLKSAKERKSAMLRRLQTNANLANAVLDENSLKGRVLRKHPTKSNSNAIKARREKSRAGESSTRLTGGIMQQLTVEIPDDMKPKKRGRPRKLSGSLPKLTPSEMDSPNVNSDISWIHAPPPRLTPQNWTPPKPEEEQFNFFENSDNKGLQDTDFVNESVDETDLHLYLSGVSDEDLSPSKESSVENLEVNPILQEYVPVIETEDISLNLPVDNNASNLIVTPPINKEKDFEKSGKTKMKGKKGKPPGLPMTEEERSRKGRKSKSSSPLVSPSLYQDYDVFKRPRTARKSMQNSNQYSPPVSSQTSASGSTFSLRKKSTRSPLEMLEMKRRQEEAIYDLEEERRQARLILLREKRYARESGDGFSDDGEILDEVPIKLCSVVLSDFVKKLQLDNIDSLSENDEEEGDTADSTKLSSPIYNVVDNQDDEDWCADLEDFDDVDDDEWLVKEKHDDRPYIPRLKLKRVMKKNKLLRIRRKNPSSGSPKAAQEPIKLVIKAEPVVDSGAPGYKASIDLSKVDRSGFEGSYLNFLKGKTSDGEKGRSSVKKKSYISSQLSPKEDRDTKNNEGKSQNVPSSPPKVPALLITPGVGHAHKGGLHEGASVLVPSMGKEDLNSSFKETALSNTPKVLPVCDVSKNLLLGEEEEEDLLILDLEEGAQDQNSSGSFKGSPVAENSDAERSTVVASHVVAEKAAIVENNDTLSTISEPPSHVQRTRSNDEMGLMLASYHELDDPSSGINQPKSGDVVTDTNREVQSVDGENATALGVVQSVDGENATALGVDEPCSTKDISSDNFNVEPAKETAPNTSTSINGQVEIVPENDQQQVGVTDLNDSVNSPDNNNVMVSAKSPAPILTEPIKKTNHVNENSKSPRQIAPAGNKPDEWKVKVILHSDKLPSGKYKCKRCDYKSSEKLSIESHIYSHIPGVQFRCSYCDCEFSSMAATWSHLKNVHAVSEAKLCISRHIEEKFFYEKEDMVFSEENVHTNSSQPININPGGQSPPVIISVLVSGSVNASRGARSGAPRRFVCTHCGFSTNVKEDAEHHTSDLHKSHNLFACLLCNENIFSSEAEIKQHSAAVHPKRQRTYGKLPDFYDAEQLNSKGKSPSQEERDNIFERMSSIFQGDETQQEANAIDHRQKAKDYLYLQEEWKEKTRVEADSTTAVDFMEDTLVEPSNTEQSFLADASSTSEERLSENEVLLNNVDADVVCEKSSQQLSCDADITSSAPATSVTTETSEKIMTSTLADDAQLTNSPNQANSVALGTDALGESQGSDSLASTCTTVTKSREDSNLADGDDTSSDDCMGLKIVQVVSLSQQNESAADDSELAECLKAVGQEHTLQPTANTTDDGNVEELKTSNKSKEDEAQSSQACPVSPTEAVATDATNTQQQAKDTEQPGSSAHTSAAGQTTASSSFASGLPLSYKCNACRVHTPYLLMMVKHLKAKHPNMRCFACPYCKATHSFISQKQLRLHVKNFHPDKIGRNEIALSEEAKKFVEAMVLPNSPECIRVGNRVVLEEDIHTCTYCQVKMTSLANVYEHLNSKHSDLFEFVCPVCQNCKSKVLDAIAIHCMHIHKSSLDTDKVHVSVPKNLFTVLTCISKGGKYIEKSLLASEDNASKSGVAPAGTSSDSQSTPESCHKSPNPQPTPQTTVDPPHSLPGTLAPVSTSTPAAVQPFVGPTLQSIPQITLLSQTPLIAIPIVSGTIGGIPTASTARPLITFSSSLFDTSSLTSPPPLIMSSASKATSVIQSTAGAASFLSPSPSLQHVTKTNPPTKQFSQQPVPRKRNSKNLPVLNIPTIKPRAPQPTVSATPIRPAHEVSISSSSTPAPPAAHHPSHSSIAFKAPVVDNLPESEPSPDAFKIFNLRPLPQPSNTMAPPTNPIVFPPVSTPISSAFIQGPLAGFPANMVLPPNLMAPYAFSQSLMHPPKMSVQPSQTSKHIRPSLVSSTPSAAPVPSPLGGSFPSHGMPSAQFVKKSQHIRAAPHMNDQRYELQRQLLLQQQKQTHSLTPSLQSTSSGHFHITSQAPSSHTLNQGPASLKHKEASHSNPLPLTLSSSPSESMARPVKGVHKRSSSIYQCPYCPSLVILKPLEVASHIQQHHPGHQVTFKKVNLNRGGR